MEDVERSESGAQGAAGQHDGGDKRYIPRNWYEGSWIMTATQAGVIDSAIDMGMVTGEMVWNVGKVLTLGVASDLSKLKIWGPSAQAYLDAKAGKYGQVRDTLEDYSEETWEFIKNYVGNPAFKAAFDNEMSAMLTDYGKSLWGLDKEAGYQRGPFDRRLASSFLFRRQGRQIAGQLETPAPLQHKGTITRSRENLT